MLLSLRGDISLGATSGARRDGDLRHLGLAEVLGFEVGDLKTGKMLHRVEVTGYQKGPVKRHGCPSHGVGLTPDEKELWLTDGANSRMHIFDATVMPPKPTASIALRDQPGWITFSMDGRYGYPSTGEVIDTKTRQIVVALTDEQQRVVQSEKVVEVVMSVEMPQTPYALPVSSCSGNFTDI